MTAQKLYETLKFLDGVERTLGLEAKLQGINEALDNLVSSPAQPQHQAALAQALTAFSGAAAQLRERIPPSQLALITEIGGSRFFDPSMADEIKNVIATNAMTPSVARDFVQDLANKRSAFVTTVRNTLQGMEKLGIRAEPVAPGSAEMAFLIPRTIFNNHLGQFAKELTFINHLIRDFSEAITGKAEPVELENLSSSVPTVTIAAASVVMLAIGNVVNKFLEAWKKIEEIREIRGRLTKIGLKGAAVDELTTQITTIVDEVVEESTELVITNYKLDNGRKNELKNALKKDTLTLFGQIERGLTIEIRAESKGAGEEGQKLLENLANLGRELQFPLISGEPILLGSGEVVEGPASEEVKVTKKTTTHKTTTKKEVHQPVKPES